LCCVLVGLRMNWRSTNAESPADGLYRARLAASNTARCPCNRAANPSQSNARRGSRNRGLSPRHEVPKRVSRRLALVEIRKAVGMNELVPEPGVSTGIEHLRDPGDGLADARDPLGIRAIGQPDVVGGIRPQVERDQVRPQGLDISRQGADP